MFGRDPPGFSRHYRQRRNNNCTSPEPAKLETSHSDKSWVAALVAESKASGIINIGSLVAGFAMGTAVIQGSQEQTISARPTRS